MVKARGKPRNKMGNQMRLGHGNQKIIASSHSCNATMTPRVRKGSCRKVKTTCLRPLKKNRREKTYENQACTTGPQKPEDLKGGWKPNLFHSEEKRLL